MYQISILSVWLAGLNGWLGYIFLADKKGWWQRLTRLSMHVVDGAGAGAGCIFGLAWLSLADGVSLNTLSNDGVLYLAWLGFWCIVWLTGLNWWLGNFEQEAVVYINGWWGLYSVYLAWLCFWLVLISPHNPE